MKRKQISTPQRERGSSQKNSLVCRQCSTPVEVISKLLKSAAADKSLLCIECFVKWI